jgi:FecR protein
MSRRPKALVGAVGAALLMLLALLVATGEAQPRAATAEVTRVTGTVEVLSKGPQWTQWSPARVGMQLAEGDQIRAQAGGLGELRLPDASTILIAENSRFAVVRLEQDPSTGANTSAFHLVAGKVRAEVTRAAVQLVRTRQSNFTISTPLGVAAVRGTLLIVAYDPSAQAQVQGTPTQTTQGSQGPATGQGIVICLPSKGQPDITALCEFYDALKQMKVLATGGQFFIIGPKLSTPASVTGLPTSFSMSNPIVSPALFDPNPTIPTFQQIQQNLFISPASTLSASAFPPLPPVFATQNPLLNSPNAFGSLPGDSPARNSVVPVSGTAEPVSASSPIQ